jgi:hypothetical protein
MLALALAGCGNGRTSRAATRHEFIISTGQECDGESNCISEVQPLETLAPDERREFTYTCSKDHPYIQNWDVSQHRFLYVTVVGFPKGGLTVAAKNYGSFEGNFSVALGCATQPTTRDDFMVSNGFRPR